MSLMKTVNPWKYCSNSVVVAASLAATCWQRKRRRTVVSCHDAVEYSGRASYLHLHHRATWVLLRWFGQRLFVQHHGLVGVGIDGDVELDGVDVGDRCTHTNGRQASTSTTLHMIARDVQFNIT